MEQLIENGDLAGVQRAVEEDPAALNVAVTMEGYTPLMWALHPASGGRSKNTIAHWLIQRGANLDLQDNDGWTALMYACRYEQPDVARKLIESGAKLDVQQNLGCTALMISCRFQPETAVLLIERGARLDLQMNDGWNALMIICRYFPDSPAAHTLVRHGTKTLDLQSNYGMAALLNRAASTGPPPSARTKTTAFSCLRVGTKPARSKRSSNAAPT